MKHPQSDSNSLGGQKTYMILKRKTSLTNIAGPHVQYISADVLETIHDIKSYVHTFTRRTFLRQREANL